MASPPSPDIAVGSFSALTGTLGMFLNVFLLYLALRNPELRKREFIVCVLNRTLIDAIGSFFLAIFQPFGILAPSLLPYSCHMAGFMDVAVSCGSSVAEAIIAGNRFVAICHHEICDKLFKRRTNQLLICSIAWIVGIGSAIPHVYYQSLGRVTGVLCAVRFDHPTLLVTVISNYIPVCLSLTLIAYFNFKIFRSFKIQPGQNLSAVQQSTVRKQKEAAKFVFVSAIVPLSLQMPATIGLLIRMYRVDMAPDWAMFGVTAAFVSCAVVSPVISLLMVRSLRREWRRMFGIQTQAVTFVEPMRVKTVNVGVGYGRRNSYRHYLTTPQ